MTTIITGWRPKKNVVRKNSEKPDWVPDWIYTEAIAAKRGYNEYWEECVFYYSQEFNKPLAETEDALIRGLVKEFHKNEVAWSIHFGPELGKKLATWFREFMDMEEIISKIKLPEYGTKLGYDESSAILKETNNG